MGGSFLTGDQLLVNENTIKEKLEAGRKVVVFLTLQDLQGDTIKEKHREIFGRDIDLLIIDETHFGARAEKYGRVLRTEGKQHSRDTDDFVEATDAEEQMKFLSARIRLFGLLRAVFYEAKSGKCILEYCRDRLSQSLANIIRRPAAAALLDLAGLAKGAQVPLHRRRAH